MISIQPMLFFTINMCNFCLYLFILIFTFIFTVMLFIYFHIHIHIRIYILFIFIFKFIYIFIFIFILNLRCILHVCNVASPCLTGGTCNVNFVHPEWWIRNVTKFHRASWHVNVFHHERSATLYGGTL